MGHNITRVRKNKGNERARRGGGGYAPKEVRENPGTFFLNSKFNQIGKHKH